MAQWFLRYDSALNSILGGSWGVQTYSKPLVYIIIMQVRSAVVRRRHSILGFLLSIVLCVLILRDVNVNIKQCGTAPCSYRVLIARSTAQYRAVGASYSNSIIICPHYQAYVLKCCTGTDRYSIVAAFRCCGLLYDAR